MFRSGFDGFYEVNVSIVSEAARPSEGGNIPENQTNAIVRSDPDVALDVPRLGLLIGLESGFI